MMLSTVCALLLGAAVTTTTPPAPPLASLDAALQRLVASGIQGTVRVIVRARPDRSGELEAAIASVEGTLLSRIEIIQAVTARIDVQRLPALQRHPAVASLSSDGPVAPGHGAR